MQTVKDQMRRLKLIGKQLSRAPDEQVSLTDPDARSMATGARGSGVVGYNVQTVVDAKHHLVVTHQVTNQGTDRAQLSKIAKKAQKALDQKEVTALADRGYYAGPEILKCEEAGINALVPKSYTSNNLAKGQFDKRDFRDDTAAGEYRCPANQRAYLALSNTGARYGTPQVLVVGLPALRVQGEVHHRRIPTHRTLGARDGARGDGGATVAHAGSF